MLCYVCTIWARLPRVGMGEAKRNVTCRRPHAHMPYTYVILYRIMYMIMYMIMYICIYVYMYIYATMAV